MKEDKVLVEFLLREDEAKDIEVYKGIADYLKSENFNVKKIVCARKDSKKFRGAVDIITDDFYDAERILNLPELQKYSLRIGGMYKKVDDDVKVINGHHYMTVERAMELMGPEKADYFMLEGRCPGSLNELMIVLGSKFEVDPEKSHSIEGVLMYRDFLIK